jgi:ABC-2 type transport system permease protein
MRRIDYIFLWKRNIEKNFKYWMEYKADFILGSTSSFISNMLSVVFFWAIFQTIPNINGWNLGQLLFLLGFLNLSLGIWNLLFEGLSPWNVEKYILNGELDRMLLKPANLFANLITSNFDLDAFGDIISGAVTLYVSINMLGMILSPAGVLLFLFLLLSSVLLFISIMTIVSTLCFWYVKSKEFSNMIMNFMRFVEFPLEIYNPVIIFALTFVIPLGFISYYPTEIMLGNGILTQIAYLTPAVSLIYFIASYKFWQFGLKRYTSTGS